MTYTKALLTAIEAHAGQTRKWADNVPYIVHPVRVAELVMLHLDVTRDDNVVQAALMHDVIEDTQYGELRMREDFGPFVTDLVLEVTNCTVPGSRAFRKAANVEHLAASSPEGASIKLADIIDNVRGISAAGEKFARVYLPEKDAALKVLTHGNPRLFAIASQVIEEGRTAFGV